MGREFQIDSLEDMCALMCDNRIPRRKERMIKLTERAKQAFEAYDYLIIFNPITCMYAVTYRDGMVLADDLTEKQVSNFFEDLEV